MRLVIDLLPFIALPALLPGLHPAFRLGGFLVLAACFIYRFVSERQNWSRSFSAFAIPLVLLVLLWSASINDIWVRHAVAPAMLGGLLLTLQWPTSERQQRIGLLISGAGYWLLFWSPEHLRGWLFPQWQREEMFNQLFEDIRFDNAIQKLSIPAFSFSQSTVSSSLLLIALTLLMTVIFLALKLPKSIQKQWVMLISVIIASMGVILLFGFHAAWIGGVGAFLFAVMISSPHFTTRGRLVFVVSGGVAAIAAYFFFKNPLLSTVLSTQQWFWTARLGATNEWGAFLSLQPLSTLTLQPSGFLYASLILFVFTLFCYQVWRCKSDDLYCSAAFLMLVAVMFSYKAPITIFANPLTWLAIGLLAPLRAGAKAEDQSDSSSEPALNTLNSKVAKALPFAAAGMLALYGINSIQLLYSDWRFERSLTGFNETSLLNERDELIQSIIRNAPYRPDAAALYATYTLHESIRRNQSPSREGLQLVDIALATSARYDTAPYLAYKWLADIYLLKTESSNALMTFQRATDAFPESALLHELYGDLLKTFGKRTDALEQFQYASNLQPSVSRLRNKIASTVKELNRSTDYELERKKLLTLNPAIKN